MFGAHIRTIRCSSSGSCITFKKQFSNLSLLRSMMDGRCQCGLITFLTPNSKPSEVYFCYCNECQHQSSSVHGISALFPAFAIYSPYNGAISVYSRQTLSGRKLDCYFCSVCGSRLLHKVEGEKTVAVKGGCLSGLDVSKAVHIWCREAVVPIPPGHLCFDGEPK